MNGEGIRYDETAMNGTELINGGGVNANELTNNQGNIYFTAAGGIASRNQIHHSYGEGIQSGGNSTSPSGGPQTFSYNVIYNLAPTSSGHAYNGFDCNTSQTADFTGGVWEHNTVFNTTNAGLTLEGDTSSPYYGCKGAVVHDNIIAQNSVAFPAYSTAQSGKFLYLLLQDQSGTNFSNNLYWNGAPLSQAIQVKDASTNSSKEYNCSQFSLSWPDTNAKCVDPLFTSTSQPSPNLTLQSGSPAINAASDGTNIGACPATSPASFPCNF